MFDKTLVSSRVQQRNCVESTLPCMLPRRVTRTNYIFRGGGGAKGVNQYPPAPPVLCSCFGSFPSTAHSFQLLQHGPPPVVPGPSAILYLLSLLGRFACLKQRPRIPTTNPCLYLQFEQVHRPLGALLGSSQGLHYCPWGTAYSNLILIIFNTDFGFCSMLLFLWGKELTLHPTPNLEDQGITLCHSTL